MQKTELAVQPVGYVRLAADGVRLEMVQDYASALEGLAGFSHLWVLFWCDRVDREALRRRTTCEKPYVKGPERLGLWATRSPVRPNPIAITPVSVIEVDVARGLVRVPYLDAEEGTPILDLKPYHPSVDRIRQAATPEWCRHWPQFSEDSAAFDWSSEIHCP
jgi:tRNA (adenine37-N6)-methyltransferase